MCVPVLGSQKAHYLSTPPPHAPYTNNGPTTPTTSVRVALAFTDAKRTEREKKIGIGKCGEREKAQNMEKIERK